VPAAAEYDAIVVGAGPYGLSTAAHLVDRGLRVGVFGKPMGLWRDHMPSGMFLRSHWWATHLSDPRHRYTFDRFARETNASLSYPIPRATFIEYGLWFQRRAVPMVDTTFVSSIERDADGFAVTLADGRQVASAAVVMAIGAAYYANRPSLYDHLPASLVSHSCDHRDFSRFSGKQLVVVGGGQSAIEYAALLHEAGAAVHVVARRAIEWRSPDRTDQRSATERIMAPRASVALGWDYWCLDRLPYAFYHLPQWAKNRYNLYYLSGASDWLRQRILGKVSVHEAQTILAIDAKRDTAVATISDGKTLWADHVMLATGYGHELDKLTMVGPSLRRSIQTRDGTPQLTPWFESTVSGFYFSGFTSWRAFGPIYRFVAGCGPAARRLARAIARRRVARSRSVVWLSWSTSAS
jgi:cation diffusion facilitator CzcD-associated flavoprotein CzcO